MEGNKDTPWDRSILYAIAAACVLGIIIVGAFVIRGVPSEGFSELYFEDPEGLPTLVDAGKPVNFTFVVVSHEGRPTMYRYNVTYDEKLIQSGNFSLQPSPSERVAIEGINKKTIKIRLVPNETSLVRMDIPVNTESRMKYNAGLGTVANYGTGLGRINVITSPRGYSVIVWGENNTTRQVDVNLPSMSDKILFPGMSRGGSQDFLIFDTSKKETFRTNITSISQVGDPSRLSPLDNTSLLSKYGYKVRREIWSISNDYGNLDVLQTIREANYRYAFKKVSVKVTSEESVILGVDATAGAGTVSGEKILPSGYEIHFWVIVRDARDTDKLMAGTM